MIYSLIAEATECDFKSELEREKPVSLRNKRANICIGNESVIAPDYIPNELILKGTMNGIMGMLCNFKNYKEEAIS